MNAPTTPALGPGSGPTSTQPTRQPSLPDWLPTLLAALDRGSVALCLCDEHDRIRYSNPAFQARFAPGADLIGMDFSAAVGFGIAAGRVGQADAAPAANIVNLIRRRRQDARGHHGFCTDMLDKSWWWLEEQKLSNGWSLLSACDISQVKLEELRLRRAHAEATHAARTDFLTGLPNRRAGIEQAEAALELLPYSSEPLSLALLDIDHFKRINDVHGHDVGDKVLTHFARALMRLMGARDEASRIGGEEFMLIMPGAPLDLARMRVARLMRALQPLDRGEGPPLAYSFSAGVAQVGSGEELQALLSRADAALYAAKAAGRQRVEVSASRGSNAA